MSRKKKNDSEPEMEYEPYSDNAREQDWYDRHPRSVPAGCRACGGDYPTCKYSCPLFDNDD